MPEKPPISDSEIYDLLQEVWLTLAREEGQTDFGNNTLKAARLSIFTLQMAMTMKGDGAIAQTPSEPSPHCD
jgi:hypothetical protein